MQRKTHLCLRTGEEAESQPTHPKEGFLKGIQCSRTLEVAWIQTLDSSMLHTSNGASTRNSPLIKCSPKSSFNFPENFSEDPRNQRLQRVPCLSTCNALIKLIFQKILHFYPQNRDPFSSEILLESWAELPKTPWDWTSSSWITSQLILNWAVSKVLKCFIIHEIHNLLLFWRRFDPQKLTDRSF